MNRTALLQETSAWTDTVDLALCLFIYGVCNDCQFGYLSGSDFVNFMNLKPTSRPVTVRPKENLRICYMVFSCNLQIFLCLFLEKLNMPQNTPVTKAS